jgi:phosphoglycerol transferase MdoB-like AlkP superfamily enzyme
LAGGAGMTATPASDGYNLTQVYDANSTFKLYKNDSLELQSKYSIIRNFKYQTQTIDLLRIGDDESNKTDFTIRNDTLYASNMLFISDGFSSVYVRVK